MKSTHFFSSSYVFERSTIFWNMVLFLEWYHGKKCISLPDKYECISIYLWWKQKKKDWLEIKSQVCGNDGDVNEMNDVVHLPPVQVLEDV